MFLLRRTGIRYSARGSLATAASRQTASLAPPLTASDSTRLWKIGEPAGWCLAVLLCCQSRAASLRAVTWLPTLCLASCAYCCLPVLPLIGALPHLPPASAPRAMAQLDRSGP
eukprot:5219862-Alexandrium_andersonii.AAC.1